MKIRTDFVTNSSSSSFVLEICIDLVDGKSLLFSANGGTGETGIIDYFWSDATVNVSPKQLGSAKSVQELIELLKNGVYDGWVSEGDKLFENKTIGGYKRRHNPTYFITMIEEYVQSMDDISRIVISGNEDGQGRGGAPYYYRTFAYYPETGDYVCKIDGCDFEKDGSSGGNLIFSDADDAQETSRIWYGDHAITTKGYAIQKRKEEKQKLREAIASGAVEAVLGETGVASKLSVQYAREISPAPESITFRGKNFVHTSCSKEDMIDIFIQSKGGEVRSSTVKTTDYLIIGNDIDHKTTKIVRAQELNAEGKSIIAMTECEFWTLAATPTEELAEDASTAPVGAPLRVTILNTYPGFSKKHFEQFIVGRGMVFKSQPNNQVDYILVNEKKTFEGYNGRYSAKVVYLPEFLELIGMDTNEFEHEMEQITQRAQAGKVRFSESGACETEILDVEDIPAKAYMDDLSLKSVKIGGCVKTIGKSAFENCANISTVILLDGITEIAERAFAKCTELESIEIPSSVKAIRKEAFANCKKLKRVVFNEGLEILEVGAIRGTQGFKELILPSSLKKLECNFSSCNIKTAFFPEGLEQIEIDYGSLVQSLKIPASAKSVKVLLDDSKKPAKIEFGGTMLDFFNIDFCIRRKCTVSCADGSLDFTQKHIAVPEGVTKLGGKSISFRNKIVTFPSTMKVIGSFALSDDTMTELVIPDGVEEVERASISGEALQKLFLPPSLKRMERALWCVRELTEIHFSGTKAQWGYIEKDRDWDSDLSTYTIFCTDGKIKGK